MSQRQICRLTYFRPVKQVDKAMLTHSVEALLKDGGIFLKGMLIEGPPGPPGPAVSMLFTNKFPTGRPISFNQIDGSTYLIFFSF